MNTPPRTIALHQPRKLVVGCGCVSDCVDDLVAGGFRNVFVVTGRSARLDAFKKLEGRVTVWDRITCEPTVAMFEEALAAARSVGADAVLGIGGGSPLDVAKLVAALLPADLPPGGRTVREVFGIGKLYGRSVHLACIPTTSGTGSEVSPNAILLDETDRSKQGVISPFLVPDAAYVDPELTLSVPPAVTAATGLDALTHCIEAYANRFAHPMIDLYALEGIKLISRSLSWAVAHGDDRPARTDVALGSLYGGLCLGPVNTGAVHALAYPLGGEFGIAHGLANSLLLPHVMAFNLPAAPHRYAAIGRALEPAAGTDDALAAQAGLERVRALSLACGVPQRLSDVGIPESAIGRLAKSAMTVVRLLERNVRTLTEQDAIEIYRKAF